jgi:hypothetical protein
MEPTLDQFDAAIAKAQAAGDNAAVSEITQARQSRYAQAYTKASAAGDVGAADELASHYRQNRAGWSRDAANSDPVWISNAKTLYSEVEKKPFEGQDADASEWLKNYMGDFNYRLLGSEKVGLRNTLGIASDVKNFSPQAKAAFLTSMDDFDAFPTFSMEGAGDAAARIATDPSTYIGLGGLGAGEGAVQGAKEAAKIGTKALLKQALKKTLVRGATSAVEGATASAVSDAARQEAEIGAGRMDSFDPTRTLEAAGKGAVVAGTIGTVTGGISAARASRKNKVTALASDAINENSDQAAMKAEHVMELKDSRDAPTNLTKQVKVIDANSIAKDYTDTAASLAKDTNLPTDVKDRIRYALLNPRATSEAELQRLEQSSAEGAAVASAIRKRKISESLTARDEGDDNLVKRGFRRALDFQTYLPPVATRAIQEVFRIPKRFEHINDKILSNRNVAVAQDILNRTGPSSATTGLDVLKDSVSRARITAANAVKAQEAQKLQKVQAQKASQSLQKEGFDILHDKPLGEAADWLDANRGNLTADQYKSYAKELIAKKKALDAAAAKSAKAKTPSGNNPVPKVPRAPKSTPAGTTGPLVSGEFPTAGIKVETTPIEPKTGVRDHVLHARGRSEIQQMEKDVLAKAEGMPQGSKLRVAHEGYIRALRTYAKNDQKLRDEALDAAMEHLSPDEQDTLWANVKGLDQRFKTMTPDDLREAVKKAK